MNWQSSKEKSWCTALIKIFYCVGTFLTLSHSPLVCFAFTHQVDIELKNAIHVVNEKFLSVALDAGIICEKNAWKRFNTSSLVLLSLSKALSPSFFRFGGTSADYLIFNDTLGKQQLSNPTKDSLNISSCANNTVLTAQDWIKLNEFAAKVGWKFLFDFNALLRDGKHWNPDDAIKLLKFNNKLGYRPIWELGNELNAHHQLQGRQLGKDFVKLRSILNSFSCSNSSLLVGPDVTGRKFEHFLKAFLVEAKEIVDAITFHHYYFNGRTATLEDFLNVNYLESLKTVIADVFKVVKRAKSDLKVWLGETSSAWGGGAPGLSDTYVAGFVWLDKLGLSAVHKVDVVIRQSLFHGNYGLLTEDLYPLPDYWLSLLYKWLVGQKVLNVTITPNDKKLRVYAHCVQNGRLYKSSNGVTVFIINLHNSTANVTVPTLFSFPVHQYLLTPPNQLGLQSMKVTLNGQELKLHDTCLPSIVPEVKPQNSSLILPPLTYGFYVFPNAAAPACYDSK